MKGDLCDQESDETIGPIASKISKASGLRNLISYTSLAADPLAGACPARRTRKKGSIALDSSLTNLALVQMQFIRFAELGPDTCCT